MYTRRCGLCGHYVILCNIPGSIHSPMQISPILIYNIMFLRIHIKASIKDFSLRMQRSLAPRWHNQPVWCWAADRGQSQSWRPDCLLLSPGKGRDKSRVMGVCQLEGVCVFVHYIICGQTRRWDDTMQWRQDAYTETSAAQTHDAFTPCTCTLTRLGEPHPSWAEPSVGPVSPSGLTLIGEPVSLEVITTLCVKGKPLGGQ